MTKELKSELAEILRRLKKKKFEVVIDDSIKHGDEFPEWDTVSIMVAKGEFVKEYTFIDSNGKSVQRVVNDLRELYYTKPKNL